MSLSAKDVAEIVRLLEETSFDELELESGDLKLSLRRGEGGVAPSTALRSPSSGATSPDTAIAMRHWMLRSPACSTARMRRRNACTSGSESGLRRRRI